MSSALNLTPGGVEAGRPLSAAGGQVCGARLSTVEVLAVSLTCAIAASLLALALGRDLNWDYFNYHGYAAFDVFGRRLEQDFFPAGFQGYMNRLAYLPFALMEHAGWHSAATAAALASIQSTNVLFLYLVTREFTSRALRPRLVASSVALLGAASSVFILQVGSTFVDPMTTPPVMAAIWVVVRYGSLRAFCCAGFLAGVAVALKLTNAPFAAGVLAAALVGGKRWSTVPRFVIGSGAGMLAGFLLLYGPWGWMLQQQFGSPVFPVFNNVFRAPDFMSQAVAYHRFVPQSLGALLSLPLEMVEHRSWIYTEGVSPDIRPAALVVLTLLAAVSSGMRAWDGRQAANESSPTTAERAAPRRLVAFFVVSMAAWLITSANGRYATPLFLLIGPMILVAASAVMGARRAAMLCLVLLPVQLLLLFNAGNPRWAANDWTATWLPATVPEALKSRPYLFVSASTSSESYVAAHVHPESVFVNPIGLIPINSGGPGWDRFVTLRERFKGRTKVMFPVPAIAPSERLHSRVGTINAAVDRLGLGIDRESCLRLVFNDASSSIPYVWKGVGIEETHERVVLVCDATPVVPSAWLAARRAEATEVLDAFESKCPNVFSPHGLQVEGSGRMWSRLYGKFDIFLTLDSEGGEIAYRMERQATEVVIGSLKTWKRDLEAFRCRLPHGGARDISTLGGDAGR